MKISHYLLVAIIFLVTTNTYGQQTSSFKDSKGDFKVGLFFSYDQNLSGDYSTETDPGMGFYYKYDRVNFTAGIRTAYYLSKTFALRSGINYSNKSHSGEFYCVHCNLVDTGKKIDLQFLEVPIALRVYPYNHKIGIFGELGIVNQFMTSKPNAYDLQGNTYSVSGLVGAGLAYKVDHGYSIQFSTEYIKGLSKILKYSDYPYRVLGIRLTLTKKL